MADEQDANQIAADEPDTEQVEAEEQEQEQEQEQDPDKVDSEMIGRLITRYALLVSFFAGIMALLVARNCGCEWPQSLWRCILATTGCGVLCMMVAKPIQNALSPEELEQKEAEEGEETEAKAKAEAEGGEVRPQAPVPAAGMQPGGGPA